MSTIKLNWSFFWIFFLHRLHVISTLCRFFCQVHSFLGLFCPFCVAKQWEGDFLWRGAFISCVYMDTNSWNKRPVGLKMLHVNTLNGNCRSDPGPFVTKCYPERERCFMLINIPNGVHVHIQRSCLGRSPLCTRATFAKCISALEQWMTAGKVWRLVNRSSTAFSSSTTISGKLDKSALTIHSACLRRSRSVHSI